MVVAWPVEEIDRLRELYAKGYSFGTIARILKRTRSSVGGKCKSLKLTREAVVKINRHQSKTTTDEGVGRKVLLDLEPHDCRWPYGRSKFTFCAEAVVAGHSYCPKHLAQSRKVL